MKSIVVIISLFFILLQQGCSEFLIDGPEKDTKMADFDEAWRIAKNVYPFFEFKKISWDSLYAAYRPEALNSKGDEMYMVLYDMFRQLKDGHIDIRTEGGFPVPTYFWPRYYKDKDAFSPEVIRRYFPEPLKLTGEDKLEYGVTNNIGYVRLQTFSGGNWIKSFSDIMSNFRNTTGMIIDLRNNTGGDEATANYITSHFIDKPFEIYFWGRDKKQYSRTLYPISNSSYLNPVIILVNGVSFSCAELFPERMRQLKNVTIVGDTTGGGGGAVGIYYLPSGKRLRLPDSYFTRNNGSMVEWNGILPDILVPQTAQDINLGHDKQLEFAIEKLSRLNNE